jgi:hypothetical protein
VKLQQESYGDLAQKGWSQSVKKLIFCQIKLYEFEKAFDNLRLLEEYLSTRGKKTKNSAEDLQITHVCGLCADDRNTIEVGLWFPKKPANGSKMSGHRMTYA